MKKLNGNEIEMILLQGHMAMRNYEAIERYRKPNRLLDCASLLLVIILMCLMAWR